MLKKKLKNRHFEIKIKKYKSIKLKIKEVEKYAFWK